MANNLEEALSAVRNPVELLRNSQIGPYAFPVVPSEFTNWRDEQRSWRETCALFDQSHHMTDLYVEGPDALKVFASLGVNTFNNFRVDTAKQFVACSYDGYVIGDAILFHLAPNRFNLVGRPPALNWVQYHVETGGYDAKATRDERSFVNKGQRKSYRYQVQGPNAAKVMANATGKPMPDIKFFNMSTVQIGGKDVRALRHGMVGQPGWELFGPWEDGEAVRDALLAAGSELGITRVGARTYPTSTLESGWIPSPLPAVYTGDKMAAYRKWLAGNAYEAMASLGGSFVSKKIQDYYFTPYDLGYGAFVKFDHEFVGRAALEKLAKKPQRQKVTLAWNGDDVRKALGSLFSAGRGVAKYIDLPLANYSTLPYDKVLKGDKKIGVSTYTGYSFNERSMLSLAIVDAKYAKPGTKVTLVWGEEGGGTSKPTVERHKQAKIRATVGPVPYGDTARTAYRPK
jgi:glycine cleavage system aminomethyltransferase T